VSVITVLKRSVRDFVADEAPVRAAALAYYTVFALPPLLVLLIMLAGLVWDPQDVQRAMETQFATIVGAEGAKAIHGMITAADEPGGKSALKTILSVAGLIFGATGAFLQLQGALNRAWEVKPDPKSGGLKNFMTKRFLSLGMILGVAFLVAVSLALSAVLSLIGDKLGGGFPDTILHAANFVLSFVVLTALFAAIFKVLPDATIGWKDVLVGAAVTSILFVVGKFAIGLYLGRSSPGEAFGAAGALAVILIWIYYAGMILLFGAEFTQAWVRSHGRDIRPEKGAVRVDADEPMSAAASAKAATTEQSKSARSAITLTQGAHTMNRDLVPRGGAHVAQSNGNGDGLADGQSVGELVKQLSTDTSHLFRQEINLAKAELKESAGHMVKGATKVGIAAGLAIPGLFAFGAFLIIALGDLMNENYWLSALIVSLAMLGVAGLMAKKGVAEFGKASFVPEETVGTLREDAEWAKAESQAFKRAFTAPNTRTH
jgi:membrane protein